jgi:hypothetical protein
MAALARRYGLSPVARALRVNYTALKRHTQARPIQEACGPLTPSAQFVEVPAGGWLAAPSAPCVIELEDRRGLKLTLRLPQGQSAATLALAQGLWRHRR